MNLNIDQTQIKILYCQYGWATKDIADMLGYAVTYVDMCISDNQWVQAPAVIDGDGNAHAIQQLKSNDYQKQLSIAPIAAVTELSLMVKINSSISELDTTDPKAHTILLDLVKAFKLLNQDAVYNKTVDTASSNNGIQVQVNTFVE